MTKRVLPLVVLITLGACLICYEFGSGPVVLAKAPQTAQETSDSVTPQTLPTAPANWILTASETSNNRIATATRAAGGAGVKHVATCISFAIYDPSTTATVGSFLYLRDGPSGTGTILYQLYLFLTPGTGVTHSVCDLNIVGSPNTPMTLEFSSGVNNSESVNLVGYDAQ